MKGQNSLKIADGIINEESRNFTKMNDYNQNNNKNIYNKEYDFELHSGIYLLFNY